MTDRDIIIIYTADKAFESMEELDHFIGIVKNFDDEQTKIIILPNEFVEGVERL